MGEKGRDHSWGDVSAYAGRGEGHYWILMRRIKQPIGYVNTLDAYGCGTISIARPFAQSMMSFSGVKGPGVH